MRKSVILLLACLMLVFSFSPQAYAQNPAQKLGRGLANIVTGWVEIPLEIGRKTSEEGDVAGFFVAPFTGFLKAIGRTLVGVYDVATFIIPIPAKYKPLIEPEFVGQEIGN